MESDRHNFRPDIAKLIQRNLCYSILNLSWLL